MRKTISTLAAITLFAASAVAQKIGTVNSNEVVFSMPETKTLQKKLEEKQKELSGQLETMYKDFETKAKAMQGIDPKSMTAIQEAKMKELQDLQKRIESFEQAAQKEVQGMEKEMSAPILEKAKKMIDQVSAEKGYTHVFDVSTGSLLVYPMTDDLTDAVIAKLGGTKPSATPAPAAAPKGK